MADDPLFRDPEFARFYDRDNGARPDLEAIARLAKGAASVLDIGCGSGLLASLLAPETRYTGADPAAAMLDIARAAPFGKNATWIQSDAESLNLRQSYDFIVLSGHAFQGFLTGNARRAALAAVARHLAPEGRFVFDSRNPACRKWEEWTPEASRRSFDQPGLGQVDAWNDVTYDPVTTIATYGTYYSSQAGMLVSQSQIAFPKRDEIAAALADNGLSVAEWWGDWDGSPFGPQMPEIIPIGGHADWTIAQTLRPKQVSGN